MHYEIVVKLKVDGPDRSTILKKIVSIQRVAVQQGFQRENIQLVQVIESTTDPVVDITSEVQDALVPPAVVEYAPTDPTDGTTVNVRSEISIQFTKNVDPATITTQTVILSQNGLPLAISLKFDAATSTVVLTPTDPLVPGKTYTVKVNQNVRSLDTVSLAAPFTWSFTT